MWVGLVMVLAALLSVCAGQEAEKEFSIRPSRDDSVSVELMGVTCTFAWRDCTGGSSEVWKIAIKAKNNGPECVVGRARDSYLTFTTWRAELSGVGDADVAVYDGTGKEMLRNSDFRVSSEASKVVVSNGKKERHSVQRIALAGVMA